MTSQEKLHRVTVLLEAYGLTSEQVIVVLTAMQDYCIALGEETFQSISKMFGGKA